MSDTMTVVLIIVLEVIGVGCLVAAMFVLRWQRDQAQQADQGRDAEVLVVDGERTEPDPDATQVMLVLTPQGTNAAAVYLASLAPGSRRTMRQALGEVGMILASGAAVDPLQFPWGQVRFAHTQLVRAQLAERYEFTTANKMLSALRGTLRVAWQLGQMMAEDYQAAVAVKAVAGATLPAGRALEGDELGRLIEACQAGATALGVRDAAMVAILYKCGLRRGELAGLDLEDYDHRQGALRVHGKRNKQRLTYLDDAVVLLAVWLNARGGGAGPLFCHVSLDGVVLTEVRLSESGIYKMVQRRARQAGVEDVSPHDFRRTFVGDLLDSGVDIATVQQMAGHASVVTTARYDRRGDKVKRAAAALLRLPVKGK